MKPSLVTTTRRRSEASSELHEERALVLNLMNHLADSLPESDRSYGTVVAPRMRQAVEHFRPFVFDPGGLPWMETLATVTRLNPEEEGSHADALGRIWDLHLERGVVPVAKTLGNRGAVDVVGAVQLLWLTDESMGCAEDGLRNPGSSAKRRDEPAGNPSSGRLARGTHRSAPHPKRPSHNANILAKWIKTNDFENAPWATNILAIQKVSQDLPVPGEQTFESPFGDEESAQSRRDRVAQLLALGSCDKPGNLANRLEQFAEELASSSQVGQYLSMFGHQHLPDTRIQAMDALSQLQQTAKLGHHTRTRS